MIYSREEEFMDLMQEVGKLKAQIHDIQETLNGEHINVGFKRLTTSAIKPTKAHDEDAGWDLYSDEDVELVYGIPTLISTGIAFELPAYHHGYIWDRSGMGKKGILVLGGLIDNPYCGGIGVLLINLNGESICQSFKKGSKITQIVFTKLPISHLNEIDELSETSRGDKGFGSSGF